VHGRSWILSSVHSVCSTGRPVLGHLSKQNRNGLSIEAECRRLTTGACSWTPGPCSPSPSTCMRAQSSARPSALCRSSPSAASTLPCGLAVWANQRGAPSAPKKQSINTVPSLKGASYGRSQPLCTTLYYRFPWARSHRLAVQVPKYLMYQVYLPWQASLSPNTRVSRQERVGPHRKPPAMASGIANTSLSSASGLGRPIIHS
jgi:hypothetical protein